MITYIMLARYGYAVISSRRVFVALAALEGVFGFLLPLCWQFSGIMASISPLDRISNFLSEPEQALLSDPTLSEKTSHQYLDLNILSYTINDKVILKDIRARLPTGQLTIIVGETGSVGFLSLLTVRFVNVCAGQKHATESTT